MWRRCRATAPKNTVLCDLALYSQDNNLIGREATASQLNPLMSICKLCETLRPVPVCVMLPHHRWLRLRVRTKPGRLSAVMSSAREPSLYPMPCYPVHTLNGLAEVDDPDNPTLSCGKSLIFNQWTPKPHQGR